MTAEMLSNRPTRRALTDLELAARAAYILRGNDLGSMTAAAPALYPHMWSWDAAFVAVGLARLSVPRAIEELDTLLSAQWRTGMLPHIVYSEGDAGYFPDADWWGCADASSEAPRTPRTSGICQPPAHAIALDRIMAAARESGGADRRSAEEFLARAWDPMLRWHRWLVRYRDRGETGRLVIRHGWESGMDNSPRWDAAYSRVAVGELPPYSRRDLGVVTDRSQRPSDREYDRYLWLIEEMRSVGYDEERADSAVSFAVEDVFMSAVLALASDALADLGEDARRPAAEVLELRDIAERFRVGVAASIDPLTGLARDRDRRAQQWLESETLAGFAPLLCGGLAPMDERRLLGLYDSERWTGNPDLFVPALPTTSPRSAEFRAREYWRGPQWPVMVWLFGWALGRRGLSERADEIRSGGLDLVRDGTFGEYYEPITGEQLGSRDQSWTAAVVLDWLC